MKWSKKYSISLWDLEVQSSIKWKYKYLKIVLKRSKCIYFNTLASGLLSFSLK